MKLVLTADIHERHNRIEVPEGDVFITAGDFTMRGDPGKIKDFNAWLATIPCKHKIIIAGNHDFYFEKHPTSARKLITNAIYLEDEETTIDGIKFYGSPWQPRFFDWAFNLDRGEALRQKWSWVPNNTDVLITHGPPFQILDKCPDRRRVGCQDLLNKVQQVKPKVHVFGHIHHSYGIERIDGITYTNASICDERYKPTNKPVVLDL